MATSGAKALRQADYAENEQGSIIRLRHDRISEPSQYFGRAAERQGRPASTRNEAIRLTLAWRIGMRLVCLLALVVTGSLAQIYNAGHITAFNSLYLLRSDVASES